MIDTPRSASRAAAARTSCRESSGIGSPSADLVSHRHSAVSGACAAGRSVAASGQARMFGKPVAALTNSSGSISPSMFQASVATGIAKPPASAARNRGTVMVRPTSPPSRSL